MIALTCDVAVIGASVGGCTAATLFARAGLRVALVERSADPANFKRICTHFIQPSAVPTINRLGIGDAMINAGGKRNILEIWTKWGWIRGSGMSRGYNLRREKLDPLMRTLAASTAGVEFMPGYTARALIRDNDRVTGVEVRGRKNERLSISARLVVGADGRDSRVGTLAGLPVVESRNNRFTYFTYYRGLPVGQTANSRYWYADANLAYAFENDDGTTLLGVFLPHDRLAEFRKNLEPNFLRFWETLEGAPRLVDATRAGEMRGALQMPNRWRKAAAKGVALVGDAAMALDPIWGTGCGFAMQSAEWLVDKTAPTLLDPHRSPAALDRALDRYRCLHRRRWRGHALHISDFSRVRQSRMLERLLFSAATRDRMVADAVLGYLARETSLLELAAPLNLLRAFCVNAANRFPHRLRHVDNASGVQTPLP